MNIIKKLWELLWTGKATPDFVHGAIMPSADDIASQPHFDEMVAKANPVDWSKTIDAAHLPNYPIRNQNGASACVAFTLALICSILYFIRTGNWIDFSAAWFYSKRSNKPGEGMVGTNAFDIASNAGALPDMMMPSDNLPEASLNYPKVFDWFNTVAAVFKLDIALVILPIKNIDTIASVIQTTGKPVMVWFDFGSGEWTQSPKILSTYTPYRHSVTAIPPSPNTNQITVGTYEGEHAIVIQDSWGFDLGTINGKRILKQSFFNTRNIFAAYPIRFKFDAVANKPFYDGTTISLQNCLKYDGEFPTNVESTGVFGAITIGAVKKFQAKYGIDQTGTVGPVTTAKLQTLFN